MATEIERKFLVRGTNWRTWAGVSMRQGYLNPDKARTVRVRQAGERGFLTVKGPTHGASRAEFEYEIPVDDANELLQLCQGPLVEKIRRCIPWGDVVWDVDEFLGENAGLVVAEVELTHENQTFARPDWLGDEVTHDPRYYNASLVIHPYGRWNDVARGDSGLGSPT